MFSINSTSSTRELVFSAHKDESFRVELKGFAVSASADVWAYTDANGLNEFFQDLGHLEKRWQGQRSWTSIEREFSLAATCTSLGKVTFRVTLLGLQGAPEEWRVEARLVTDLGQLEKIAKHAGVFFNE
ncbi:DUF6228 family protein [Accumulibacter sp.]|uniref:DUF6228 family protein n=1 Tax=Accumulibacter sp. TaxID=2053492 RepID=UPI002633725F|nr:DUF6228 family protein [Accumulibacter sp.]HRE71001.1 DUF6228 family protein [Accumulibacter sp.]